MLLTWPEAGAAGPAAERGRHRPAPGRCWCGWSHAVDEWATSA